MTDIRKIVDMDAASIPPADTDLLVLRQTSPTTAARKWTLSALWTWIKAKIEGNAVLVQLPSYTVSTLPSAAAAGRLIYVADGAANKRLAVSDGTNWRWPDGTTVS